MTEPLDIQSLDKDTWLYSALSWMSPAWPIGAFAYSSGLEWAHEAGWLSKPQDVQDWLADNLRFGNLYSDAGCFVRAYDAAGSCDADKAIAELAEFALAAQLSHERSLETTNQGEAFKAIAISANGSTHTAQVQRYELALANVPKGQLSYPIAAGALFSVFAIPKRFALLAYLHAAISNLLSAAQRIVPLGHTDTQILLTQLSSEVQRCVEGNLEQSAIPIEQTFTNATLSGEIACMAHETQYTRLFRT